MLLEPIYEPDFHAGSFGFRPSRSPHQALDSLREQLMNTPGGGRGGWVLEVDIRKFFDTLDHAHLREFVGRRVRDGVWLRLIGKWHHRQRPVVVRVPYVDGAVVALLAESPSSGADAYVGSDECFTQEIPSCRGNRHSLDVSLRRSIHDSRNRMR